MLRDVEKTHVSGVVVILVSPEGFLFQLAVAWMHVALQAH